MVLMGVLGTTGVVLADVVVRRVERDKPPAIARMSARCKEKQTQDDLLGGWMGVW